MRSKAILTALLLLLPLVALGQGSYKQPPKEILDVLNAPPIPTTTISPARDKIAMLEPQRYPPITELAQPMLRIAGLRINPLTNAQHREIYSTKLTLKNISDGREMVVALPAGAKILSPEWSPDGKHIALGNITPTGVELWIVDTATAKATKVSGILLNTAMGNFSWADPHTIAANIVPGKRGVAAQYEDVMPDQPAIQETSGRRGAVVTYEDLLQSPNDEKLFEYYCTSQIALVDTSGKVRTIGDPAIFANFDLSPDGKYVLVQKVHRPFSYQFPFERFPRKVEVWNSSGHKVADVTDTPLQDALPNGGVQTGPRNVAWIPTENATLIWVEALDGGNPRTKVTPRDRLVTLAAPFGSQPAELLKVENRLQGRVLFGEKNGFMWFSDTNRDTRHRRVFVTDYHNPAQIKMISDLNENDRYNELGQPVMKLLPTGSNVIRQDGDKVYLVGNGASPDGDRPFLRQFDLATLDKVEMFRSGKDKYESFVGFAGDNAWKVIMRRESQTDPPNLIIRDLCDPKAPCDASKMAEKPITNFTDPTPQLRGITKQLVKYKRADGVDLSFTLYLPPGYKQGTPLPTVVWAYPLEFNDTATAGQVTGSSNRFTQITGYSELFFALEGYAVLDNATMPIVGDPQTMNDTFIEQIVSSSKAAIDKAVEMGVTDRDRVGVGGHSYGAFMTANLLAHSDLFRAGIARSGAYNRTLTPFGFQNERRTFWEAPELYEKMSPFFFADKIHDPLLMIHGE
ncbi:MAG: S9 family peptidase, partial [Acidobacteria bacterium]|nr:S9 family peptidase [Acidobacteriota bacterium]